MFVSTGDFVFSMLTNLSPISFYYHIKIANTYFIKLKIGFYYSNPNKGKMLQMKFPNWIEVIRECFRIFHIRQNKINDEVNSNKTLF